MIHAAQQLKAAGRIDEAKVLLEKDPEHQEAWKALELIYASQGDYEELLDMRRVWVDHASGDGDAVARLEQRMGEDGVFGYWEWRLEELQGRQADGRGVSPVYMAAASPVSGRRIRHSIFSRPRSAVEIVVLRRSRRTRFRTLCAPIHDSNRS